MKRFIGRWEKPSGQSLEGNPSPENHGSLQVLYRGYIANLAELVAEGKRRGEALEGGATGLLFARAFSWWGEGLQAKVLGEYSVAVYDEQHRTLLLTHDAVGILPLFYADVANSIVFASHLDWLVRFVGTGALDIEYITDMLTLTRHMGEGTPYRKIRRLLPGRSLICTEGRIATHETWSLAPYGPVSYATDSEYEEHFRVLLREGVSAALQGNGPVWSELSGGLDSSSIVSMAAHMGTKLQTVSFVSGQHWTGNETKWMRAVVEKFQLDWHVVDIDLTPPFSEIPTEFYAEPNPAMLVEGFFRRYRELLTSSGVEAILSGSGGDEILMGDPPEPVYLADAFIGFKYKKLLRGLRAWQAARRDSRSLLFLFIQNVLAPSLDHIRGRPLRSTTILGLPPYLHARLRSVYRARHNWHAAVKSRSVGDQCFSERIRQFGLMAGTALDQRTNTFEFRFPLLYRPLVEFMFAIPWEQKMQPDWDRHLQRRALKGILPEKVRLRRSKGGPEQSYFEGLRNSRAWREILTDKPLIVEYQFVDAETWTEAVAQARCGRTYLMSLFLTAANLEMWLRQLSRFPQVQELSELTL